MLQSLRRWSVVLVIGATAAVVPLAYGSHGAQSENGPAGQIGAGGIALDEGHLLNPSLVRAFVPTGSRSHRCLVTLGESTGVPNGSLVFCGARNVGGVDGVLITITLNGEPSDLFVTLTVYQQFAKQYGAPELYTGN